MKKPWRYWILSLGLLADGAGAQQSLARGAVAQPREPAAPPARALGDAAAELLYTPVAPCRVVDTRFATAGPLAPGVVRDFFVAGTLGFVEQGGQNGGCGIPFGPATAVMFNFIAVTPAGDGNLRAWAYDNPVPPAPNASIINYGETTIANGVVVPICPDGGSCATDLLVRADVSGTHLVADVLGYFSAFPKGATRVIYSETTDVGTIVLGSFAACAAQPRTVTISAPGPGRVVVEGSVSIRVTHVTGSDSTTHTGIMPSPVGSPNCLGGGRALQHLDQALPSGDEYVVTLHPRFSELITGGSHSYALVADHSGGPASDGRIFAVQLWATYYPD